MTVYHSLQLFITLFDVGEVEFRIGSESHMSVRVSCRTASFVLCPKAAVSQAAAPGGSNFPGLAHAHVTMSHSVGK